MESVEIDIDPEKEQMVPRPEPDEERLEEANKTIQQGESMLEEYRGTEASDIVEALTSEEEFGGFQPKEDDR